MLPPFLKKTAEHFRTDEVSDDKAFCTAEVNLYATLPQARRLWVWRVTRSMRN